ncbi:dihydrofolate reductase family protein [Plantactinospora sp. WMMB334]|uniref:dihydrofolate reductase family protein n=1 Tax=Plantactinospora sp. WMMB334 TaxID=3404119 RepID=UPI003B93F559
MRWSDRSRSRRGRSGGCAAGRTPAGRGGSHAPAHANPPGRRHAIGFPTHAAVAAGAARPGERGLEFGAPGGLQTQFERPALREGVTSPYAHLRQIVFSGTLTGTDPEVEIVDTDPVEFVRTLKRAEGQDIWLCGGGRLAGALLPEIDELIVKRCPVAIGAGIPLFAGVFRPVPLALTGSRTFDSGAAVVTYTPAWAGTGISVAGPVARRPG